MESYNLIALKSVQIIWNHNIIIDCDCQVWFIFIQEFKKFVLPPAALHTISYLCVRVLNIVPFRMYIIYHFWIIACDWRWLAGMVFFCCWFSFFFDWNLKIEKFISIALSANVLRTMKNNFYHCFGFSLFVTTKWIKICDSLICVLRQSERGVS